MTTLPAPKKISTKKASVKKKPATKKSTTKKATTPKVPSKSILPFSKILSASWQRLQSHKKALFLPALCSLPSAMLQNFPDTSGGGDMGNALQDGVSFIPKALADNGVIAPELSTGIIITITLVVLAIIIFFMVVQYIAFLYSLQVIYDEHTHWKATTQKSLSLFFPYIGLLLWLVVRTYIWIPLLAIIASIIFAAAEIISGTIAMASILVCVLVLIGLSVYFGPRLGFAEVIFLKEKKGIKESVELSWQRTEGYWAKVVGNSILYGLCVFGIAIAALIAAFILFTIVFVAVKFVSEIAGGAGLMIAAAIVLGIPAMVACALAMQYLKYWAKCFSYEMARTIFENPLTAKKK